jgi:hypothetical protein
MTTHLAKGKIIKVTLFGGCPVMISLHPSLYSSRAPGGLRRRRFIRRGSLELKEGTLIRESSKRVANRCYVLRLASCVQASLHDLDRFAKRQAGESGWLAYVVDWRDLYMRVPQCLASGSGLVPQGKVQEYLLLYTVIIGKIQRSRIVSACHPVGHCLLCIQSGIKLPLFGPGFPEP